MLLLLLIVRFWNTTVGKVANTVFQLFLKYDTEHTWSVYQINNIPTCINGWNIVLILAANVFVDATGCRMTVVAINLCLLLFGTICLVVWEIPLGLRVVSYMLAGTDGPLSPIYMTWANILLRDDKQVRALTIAFMTSCGNALTTIIQQFLYDVTDAPEYKKGFPASLGFIIGMCGWVILVRCIEIRITRKDRAKVQELQGLDSEIAEVNTSEKLKGGTALTVIRASDDS